MCCTYYGAMAAMVAETPRATDGRACGVTSQAVQDLCAHHLPLAAAHFRRQPLAFGRADAPKLLGSSDRMVGPWV